MSLSTRGHGQGEDWELRALLQHADDGGYVPPTKEERAESDRQKKLKELQQRIVDFKNRLDA